MKGMNFPIDIVWLNKDKKVIYIVKNAPFDDQTTIYKPRTPALYVIELPAWSDRRQGDYNRESCYLSSKRRGKKLIWMLLSSV
jgi:hypothetical protein